MKSEAVFIYSNQFQNYKFHDEHPFNQLRVELTYSLLKQIGVLDTKHMAAPRMATVEEIALFHDPKYIEALQLAGKGELSKEKALHFGIGTEDTPIFPNMHEASALIVGATLKAVELVMDGKVNHALNLGGGLHHGFRGKASGFCIYNDSAVAIQYILKKYKKRVLYVDTDAHHGDGVQWAFYDTNEVCTLSIHETGRYLFPGTGNVNERGSGKGYGYSFNIPVDAFTEDESFLEMYETSMREIAAYFKPEVIVTQNGADAHYYDPLTHLSLTSDMYRHIPRIAHEIAHQYAEGRWIAVGGGGYDIWRVVPRAWAFLWLEMIGMQDAGIGKLPQAWLEKWHAIAPVTLPATWEDPADLYSPIPRKEEITEKNHQTLTKLLQPLRQHHI